MESLPNRFCVVCTGPLGLEAIAKHGRHKARKCVDCKDGKLVADIPHCVHCRAELPNQRRESWACRPLCLEGEASKGLECMKATPCKCEVCEEKNRIFLERQRRMNLCQPRPAFEREMSRQSKAGVDTIPEMGTLRDDDAPGACRYVYEARPIAYPHPRNHKGSIFDRIETKRKKRS